MKMAATVHSIPLQDFKQSRAYDVDNMDFHF